LSAGTAWAPGVAPRGSMRRILPSSDVVNSASAVFVSFELPPSPVLM